MKRLEYSIPFIFEVDEETAKTLDFNDNLGVLLLEVIHNSNLVKQLKSMLSQCYGKNVKLDTTYEHYHE